MPEREKNMEKQEIIREWNWINNKNRDGVKYLVDNPFLKITDEFAFKNKVKITVIYDRINTTFDYTPEEDERSRVLEELVKGEK